MTRTIISALACTLPASAAFAQDAPKSASQPAETPLPIKSLRINSPTPIRIENASDAGAYVIDTDNTTFDLGGSTLVGAKDDTSADQYVGRAIVIRKAKNVTLKNVKIRGFKIAIYAEDAPGLCLENCDVSNNYRMHLKSTPQREHYDDWLWGHENDENQWLRYGAGIYLLRCDRPIIRSCHARNGQNGLCLVRSNEAVVQESDMSFMSGWGLAMWRSSKCRVLSNRFDYCVRGYSHGVYNRGQDSAGILVFEQCSDNIFAYNSATHGGDGFFLYAGNETLKKTGTGGCNRNILYKNDFSHAVTNGIETTFSDSNVIVGNTLTECDNGLWAGYSSKSLIAQNHFEHCNVGIALEHGRGNKMEWNDFIECKRGIWLWWDDDADLVKSAYATHQGHLSDNEMIISNFFQKCGEAILLSHSTNVRLAGNRLEESKVAVRLKDGANIKDIGSNTIVGGLVDNECDEPLLCRLNHEDGDSKIETKGKVSLEKIKVVCADGDFVCRKGALSVEDQTPKPPIPAAAELAKPSIPQSTLPAPGRASIFIDEWGPYDFVEPRLFPANYTGSPPIAINVLGPPRTPFKILPGIDPHFEALPAAGDAPGKLTITPRTGNDAPAPGAYPFELNIKIGKDTQRLSGTVIVASWNVRYIKWDPSLDPRNNDENWRKITASAPIKTEKRDNLDLPWGGGGPTPDVTEHFALTAETQLTLPAGEWRLRTISDDGVRVYFGNKRVIDNWTWHVPTEDSAIVEATTGPNEIRVEYFEITGHAQLQFFLEPQ